MPNIIKIKNKRALSDVIATVLIILLAITAIAIIWVAITSFIEPTLSPQFSCLELRLSPPLSIQKACITQANEVEIKLSRDGNIEINSIRFVISSDTDSISLTCGQSCSKCSILAPGKTKNYFINSSNLANPRALSLFVENCALLETPLSPC